MKAKNNLKALESKQTVKVGKFTYKEVDPDLLERCERESFYLLGKLSTKFAQLEELIQEFIFELALTEVVGQFFIEKNNLDSNLKLLENLNEYYEFENDDVIAVIKKVNKIKATRNKLIHGTWFIHPAEKVDKIIINVRSSRINVTTDGNKKHKSWSNITETDYSIFEINELIESVTEINNKIEELKLQLISEKEDD